MSSLINKAKGFVAEKVAHVQKPEASLKGVSIKNVGRDGAQFHSDVSVDNPYSHRLPVCEITYTLKSADRIVASGTMADPGWIEASKATTLEIPFKVPYDFLISLLRDIGRDWDIDYVFDVGLTIDLPIIGNFTIPLSTKGELKLPSFTNFFSGDKDSDS
ncbi:late embryogenesis abundant protein Lea14-A-like [Phalaenopsis equestris]|uniref:late embryogenesis abundant protein Lea14-A-like n=1 Tax=Phalaenopsis equestris TaxID=78828 RepID=UPI0009E3A79D|nr:late embryogenesis abundant protein Lea14-A-like [Phalaenopsis equestris]